MRFNNDADTNYHWQYLLGKFGIPQSGLSSDRDFMMLFRVPSSHPSVSTGFFGVGRVLLPDYANGNKKQSCQTEGTHISPDQPTTSVVGGYWDNTDAIHTIALFPEQPSGNFVADTVVTLYGLK